MYMNQSANNSTAARIISTVREMDRIERIVPQRHPMYSLIHFLVWEAHSFRLFLELMFVFISYNLIYLYFSVKGFLPLPASVHFAILGMLAVIVIFFDSQVLCKSNTLFKKAYLKAYSGNMERALELIHSANGTTLPPSPEAYHLALSEFHLLNGSKIVGDFALESAIKNGASPLECLYIRMRSIIFSGSKKNALEGLSEYLETSSLVQFENGVALLANEETRKDARACFKRVLDSATVLHPSGAESHDLANLMLTCLDLHIGKAEEALRKLQMMFEILIPELKIIPALRPYVALAYLERARYYARKKNTSKQAGFDLERAMAICSYPLHIKIKDRIEEQLEVC